MEFSKVQVHGREYNVKDAVSRNLINNLSRVATTGDYDDLTNKPVIPTKTSDLTNDSGYITKNVNDLTNYTLTSNLSNVATSGSYNDLSDKPVIPTKTSDLINDSGYITKNVNDLTNYTLTSNLSNVATSGDYDDLINKPVIPIVPTNISAFINDSGYITKNVNDLDNYTLTSNLSSVATSGNYNDLSNKPTIPTKTSDLSNDSNFTTKSYVDGYVNSTSGNISTGNITVNNRIESKFFGKYLGSAEANTTTSFEITGTCGILFLYNSWGTFSCFLFNKITSGGSANTFVITALVQPQNHSLATVDGTHISVTCGGIKMSVFCLQFN